MAVGRYQHAHAASTYSYTLALSRSPSPLSCPIPFCNLLTLSSFHHLTFLSCPSLMYPPFSPSQTFAPIILPFVSISLSFSLFFFFLCLIHLFSSKHYLPSFLFSYFHSRFQFLFYLSVYLLLLKIYFFLLIICHQFSLRVLSLSLWVYTAR